MGELHDAVTALLDAFIHGISVIRAQGSRRKEERLSVDPVQQTAETHVRKSLKKSKADVNEAYRRDLARYGSRFASGDAESHSSLSSILSRLNAAFTLVIERFTTGRSTRMDYNTLMSLSNASRSEAIQTFEQLSKRLPQSSLSLTPSGMSSPRHAHSSQNKRPKQVSSSSGAPNPGSKSTPSLSITPAPDQPRPRHLRKKKSPSSSKPPTVSRKPHSAPEKHHSKPSGKSSSHHRAAPSPDQKPGRRHTPRSLMSDSTKLGEIPEHKWTRDGSSLRVAYPLYSYAAPPKQRSRFMRFFGK